MITKALILREASLLSPLRVRTIFLDVLKYATLPADDAVLTPGDAMVIWAASLLEKLAFLDADQRSLLLRAISPTLQDAGGALAAANPSWPSCQLGFLDARYAVWTGQTRMLDLLSGELVTKPPVAPLEALTYNLTTLWRRKCQKLQI